MIWIFYSTQIPPKSNITSLLAIRKKDNSSNRDDKRAEKLEKNSMNSPIKANLCRPGKTNHEIFLIKIIVTQNMRLFEKVTNLN